jgi:hypothetical protein
MGACLEKNKRIKAVKDRSLMKFEKMVGCQAAIAGRPAPTKAKGPEGPFYVTAALYRLRDA